MLILLFRKHYARATAGERSLLQKVIASYQFFASLSSSGVKLEEEENSPFPKDFCQNKQPYDQAVKTGRHR